MPRRYDYIPSSRRIYPNGAEVLYTPLPFSSIARIEKIPCPDGVLRTFHTGSEPLTVNSVPGFVYARGKTVRGYAHYHTGLTSTEGWTFAPNPNGLNRALVEPATNVDGNVVLPDLPPPC